MPPIPVRSAKSAGWGRAVLDQETEDGIRFNQDRIESFHRQHQGAIRGAVEPGVRVKQLRGHGQRLNPCALQNDAAVALTDHVAVTAGTGRVHVHRLDMGPPFTDGAALAVQQGFAVLDQTDVGGGAADIDHQGIGETRRPRRNVRSPPDRWPW
jgi:hypothetical protein